MTYKKQKMMNADVLTFSQGSLSGSGYIENDSSESQCCSQKALLLFHHSFVDHYLEAYVCSVKQHWKDDVLKSYNSSRSLSERTVTGECVIKGTDRGKRMESGR